MALLRFSEIKGKILTHGNTPIFSHVLCDFLVACYTTLHPALSVGPSVRRSVTLYFFLGFAGFGLTASAQMIW